MRDRTIGWMLAGVLAGVAAACGGDDAGSGGTGGPEVCTPYLESDAAAACAAACTTDLKKSGVAQHYCTIPCDENGACPESHQCITTAAASTCVLLCGLGCPAGMTCGGSFCDVGP